MPNHLIRFLLLRSFGLFCLLIASGPLLVGQDESSNSPPLPQQEVTAGHTRIINLNGQKLQPVEELPNQKSGSEEVSEYRRRHQKLEEQEPPLPTDHSSLIEAAQLETGYVALESLLKKSLEEQPMRLYRNDASGISFKHPGYLPILQDAAGEQPQVFKLEPVSVKEHNPNRFTQDTIFFGEVTGLRFYFTIREKSKNFSGLSDYVAQEIINLRGTSYTEDLQTRVYATKIAGQDALMRLSLGPRIATPLALRIYFEKFNYIYIVGTTYDVSAQDLGEIDPGNLPITATSLPRRMALQPLLESLTILHSPRTQIQEEPFFSPRQSTIGSTNPSDYISSQAQLPSTISIGRTPASVREDCSAWVNQGHPIEGVDTDVPFHEYIKVVTGKEWGVGALVSDWHPQALRAGAISVKTYALYKSSLVELLPGRPRSVTIDGQVARFNILDNVCEQLYDPDLYMQQPISHRIKIADAVDATLTTLLKRSNATHLFELEFRDIASNCAVDPRNHCVPQVETQADAEEGIEWQAILEKYLSNGTDLANDDLAGTPLVFHSASQFQAGDSVEVLSEVGARSQPTGNHFMELRPSNRGTMLPDNPSDRMIGEAFYRLRHVSWDPRAGETSAISAWVADGYFLKQEVSGGTGPQLRIQGDTFLPYCTKTARSFFGHHTYKVRARIKNVGASTATAGRLCFSPSFPGVASDCLGSAKIPSISPGQAVEVSLSFTTFFDLNSLSQSQEIGKLWIQPASVQPSTVPPDPRSGDLFPITTDHYRPICLESSFRNSLAGAVCTGSLPVRFAELAGLRINPDSNEIEFLMRTETAQPGDPTIDLEATRDEFIRIFLQALATPNYKQWISLEITGYDSGFANIPHPFQNTDLADAFLHADVAMKEDLFGRSDTAVSLWTSLVMSSNYWPEFNSKEFFEYPEYIIAATIIPGDRDAHKSGMRIYFTDVFVGLDAGWWWQYPIVNTNGYGLSPGALNEVANLTDTYASAIQSEIRDYSASTLVPIMNSSTSDSRYRRVRSIYTTIAVAQWYKTQVYQNGSLPYAHLIDSEDLSGIEISPPFSQAYWNDQANEILWTGPCDTFWGPGLCEAFGGFEFSGAAAQIQGSLTGAEEEIITDTLDRLETVQVDGDYLIAGGSIVGAEAELAIGATDFSDEVLLAGDTALLEIEVTNGGGTAVASVVLRTTIQNLDLGTGPSVLDERIISVDETSLVTEVLYWPVPLSPARYRFEFTIDATDQQIERNEDNNRFALVTQSVSRSPRARIFSPEPGLEVFSSSSVLFAGEGFDFGDGFIGGPSLSWSSDRDGFLATGSTGTFSGLSLGLHLITLTATDSEGLSGTAETSVNILQDMKTLTILRAGSGAGRVTGDLPGIDCGNDCSESYLFGASMTLTATPDLGSAFAGWSDDACPGTAPCTITMDSDITLTATFEATDYQVTVLSEGVGFGTITSSPAGIDCEPDCSETYSLDTELTLTATPQPGSTFSGWTGDCTGTGNCILTVDGDLQVAAVFDAACVDRVESAWASWLALEGPENEQSTTRWTVSTEQSFSPASSWFVEDLHNQADEVLLLQYPVSVSNPEMLLRFYQLLHLTEGAEGGALEYSLDAGITWIDILEGNGGAIAQNQSRIVENPYTSLINVGMNPLDLRLAWSEAGTDWKRVTVDLSDFVGQQMYLRWRYGGSPYFGGGGWWIDQIAFLNANLCPFHIFTDGFESGDLTRWSLSRP